MQKYYVKSSQIEWVGFAGSYQEAAVAALNAVKGKDLEADGTFWIDPRGFRESTSAMYAMDTSEVFIAAGWIDESDNVGQDAFPRIYQGEDDDDDDGYEDVLDFEIGGFD